MYVRPATPGTGSARVEVGGGTVTVTVCSRFACTEGVPCAGETHKAGVVDEVERVEAGLLNAADEASTEVAVASPLIMIAMAESEGAD